MRWAHPPSEDIRQALHKKLVQIRVVTGGLVTIEIDQGNFGWQALLYIYGRLHWSGSKAARHCDAALPCIMSARSN